MKYLLLVNIVVGVLATPFVDSTDTEVVVLRAVRGGVATLPCGQGKVFLDGPLAYVLWLKNDRDILYRYPNPDSTSDAESVHFHEPCVTGEGVACPADDDTSLVIKHVTDTDGGRYRCRVHYHASPSQDYVIEVRIVDATGVPRIYNEDGEEITIGYIGPISLGSNFTLICEVEDAVDGDSGETLVYWRRNGVALRLDCESSQQGRAHRAIVTARNVTRDELDAHYDCVAHNADVTEPLTRSVVVKMYLPPLSVEIRLNQNVNFEVGSPRLVDCIVIGCVPTPIITWQLDQHPLRPTSHKEVHEGTFTVSSLSLSPSLGSANRSLRCGAHNPHLPHQVHQDNITIHVGYGAVCASGITVVPHADERETHDGAETVKCEVESVPEPVQFTWSFPDSRILVTAVQKVAGKANRYSSTLTWVPSDGDAGTLLCRATNSFGEQKQACEYSVHLPAGTPSPPKCNLKSAHPAGITVHCDKGWDGGRPQQIHIEVNSDKGALLYNGSNSHGHFHLDKFSREASNLSVRLYAANTKGTSSSVYLHLENPAPATASVTDLAVSRMLMYGAIAGTVLLGVAIAGMWYVALSGDENGDVPDVVPTIDGTFHREPELDREERIQGTTNITVNQLATCHNQQYSSWPLSQADAPRTAPHAPRAPCAPCAPRAPCTPHQQSFFV